MAVVFPGSCMDVMVGWESYNTCCHLNFAIIKFSRERSPIMVIDLLVCSLLGAETAQRERLFPVPFISHSRKADMV